MLKKQTVWLLTMLSLLVILSVYYMTSPSGEQLAFLGNDNEAETTSETIVNEPENAEDATVNEMTNSGQNEYFASVRMEMQNKRGKTIERLKATVASSSATTEEINEAKTKMNQIDTLQAKEQILEEAILAAADYKDVLVRYDEDVIHVSVQTDELPRSEAVNIMQMANDEFSDKFGDMEVNVSIQPMTK